MNFTTIFQQKLPCPLRDATDRDIYVALLETTKECTKNAPKNTSKSGKKVYYISAEFLIGKLLSNNLINLGVYEEVRTLLAANGKDICAVGEQEPEPSLGNGGLGRLAACFLDSMATLGLEGDGIGLNYHLGLFQQVFKDHKQTEIANPWLESQNWLTKTATAFDVPFGNFTLRSNLYDLDVIGYESGVSKLHLFDLDTVDESLVTGGISFDKEDIQKNLTLFLYPDDSDHKGELLRIYQQYFMVSNGAQLILKELEEKGHDIRTLDHHVAIQINDTHPSLVIPELIRLLTARGLTADEAVALVSKTCAYTNHTILAEALEKWPLAYLEDVVPHLVPIIQDLAARVKATYENPVLHIIDENKRVHMARMDMHYGYSVNGVAALHTEILKAVELRPFYEIYPEKFNNKTNGITFRRWLLHCNHDLVDWMDNYGAGDFRKDADQLENLLAVAEDEKALIALLQVKQKNKLILKEYLHHTMGVSINEHSIFDIQIKRLHEYKRQQMNVLYVIHKYLDIKAGNLPSTPITIIFGAKAAPAYVMAQNIIHVILCLQELIANNPGVSPHLQVVMVENYNVTAAEKLIPACDLSEQISLASKEASGTGNMKFMLNGAVTIGTLDGANKEIHQLVGAENIYTFGKGSDEVIGLYESRGYVSADFYNTDADIHAWVDFIISPELAKIGDIDTLHEVWHELIHKDWFMTLLDVKDYVQIKEQAFADYENRLVWSKKMLMNIAKAGFFSSDRTIAQYNNDIWKV